VPQGPGGTSDVMARLFAAYLGERWGTPIVVENKAGGGGVIGTQELLRSPADGHTLLLGGASPQAIAYSVFRSVPYTPDDVIGASNMITGPNVLIVNKDLPANSVREFADYLRQNPDKLNFGTPSAGTTPHLAGVWFNSLIGAKSAAVHYRGSALAMTDLLAGRMQYSFDALVNAREQIRGGTVRALGVTGSKRFPSFPELPTMTESMPELASFVSESWVGIFVAKGTPSEVVQALNQEIAGFLGRPETPSRFLDLGGTPDYQTVERYAAFVKDEIAKWAKVVRDANIQVDL
jgi:tripartite-type tricarboxylate transporter receptor subunit TctC